ncbi:MAG: leucine-rich repeat protein [Candidatus Methanomethylophilaceae archaeon]|nr:leucine-rich repeat protein [Candidatus Methanomethylophilaceae archaeon]
MLPRLRLEGKGEQSRRLALFATAVILLLSAVLLFQASETSDGTGDPSPGIGSVFSDSGLRYEIVSAEPCEAMLTGSDKGIDRLTVPAAVRIGDLEAVVVSIGDRAFYGSDLSHVDLGDVSDIGKEAFAGCIGLREVVSGGSLMTIGEGAFAGCRDLAEVSIEDSAKTLRVIGTRAFDGCLSLERVSVPSYLSTLGMDAFSVRFADSDGKTLKQTVKGLGGFVYAGSDGTLVRQEGPSLDKEYTDGRLLYTVKATLPAELRVSGYAKEFRNIAIPESLEFDGYEFKVTSIGDRAFKNYVKIRTVSMPSIEKIGKEAFYGCKYIKPVDMDSIRSIGVKAFAKCVYMEGISFGESLEKISAYAFYGCKAIGSLEIPDSVALLGSYAFFRCYSLQQVSLGESLKKICSHTFARTSIEEITIPSKVERVGVYAFSSCTYLESVDFLGESVSIGTCAFSSCPSIERISMPADVQRLGSGAFDELEFRYSDGAAMDPTAKNLSSKTFEHRDGSMVVKEDRDPSRIGVSSVGYDSSRDTELRITADRGLGNRECDYFIYDSTGTAILRGTAVCSGNTFAIMTSEAGLPEGSYMIHLDDGDAAYRFDILRIVLNGNCTSLDSRTVLLSEDSLASYQLPKGFDMNTGKDRSGRNVSSLSDLEFEGYEASVYAFYAIADSVEKDPTCTEDTNVRPTSGSVSKKSLKDHLKSRMQAVSEARFGGKECMAYWMDQALESAKGYLVGTSFSREGLKDQLVFDKFTADEAEFAVERCGGDWKREALDMANSYLDALPFSKEGLRDQLIYKKFTCEEAEYAVEFCRGDWNEEALDIANECLRESSVSKEDLKGRLLSEKFTDEEAAYAIDHCEADWNGKNAERYRTPWNER